MSQAAGAASESTIARYPASTLAQLAADYAENGVAYVPGLLSGEWLERLGRAVESVRSAHTRGDDLAPIECFSAPGRMTIRWMSRAIADVRAFFTDSGVAPVVGAIIGARRLQYWFDLTFVHENGPDSVGTPWHHDIAAFPFEGTQIPSLWIAMSDIPLNMAPLQVVKGSHRNPVQFRPPVYLSPDAALPEGYDDMPDVPGQIERGEIDILQWPVAAGDALIIHPYALHGAPPNATEARRIAFTTRWMGDDVRWKPDAFSMDIPGIDYASVQVGQRPSGPAFPYIGDTE